MTTLEWTVEFTETAVALFEEAVPKKFRKTVLEKVLTRLSQTPDVESGKVKQLSSDREPFFPGRNVWQLRVEDYRFFYELLDGKVVIVFFVGIKDTQTTAEMLDS